MNIFRKYNINTTKTLTILGLAFLIIVSLFPRSVEILNKNYLFLFDQGRDYLAVRDIVVNHKPTLIGAEIGAGSAGFSYIFHGPGHYYLLTIPFVLFNGDPYGGVVLMWALSILAIFFGFLLGKLLFKSTLFGIMFAILLAISPPLISQARFVWNSHPTTPFIVLFFICTFLIYKRPIYIFLAAFFSGIIYNFELGIAVPLSLALLIYLIFIQRSKKIKNYIYLFAGLLISYSPAIFFEVRHSFPGLSNLLNYAMHKSSAGAVAPTISMKANLIDHFKTFSYNIVDSFPSIAPGNSEKTFLVIILAALIFGVSVWFLKKEKDANLKKFIIFTITLPFITFLVFAFLRNWVWGYYLIHLNIAYSIIFIYLIFASWKNKKKELLFGFAIIYLIFCLFAAKSSYFTTKYDYSDYGGFAKIKGRIDAIDYVYKDAKGKPFGFFVFSPPIYTYPYDYLLLWYGNNKYGYVPTTNKSGTFYLLMERDPAKPESHIGWLETVIKTGKVIDQRVLPSGLLLQKRIAE